MLENAKLMAMAIVGLHFLVGCSLGASSGVATSLPARFIAVGEIHGTRQSTDYVLDLATRITSRGTAVLLLVEQPREDFPPLVNDPTQFTTSLQSSRFWQRSPGDGRRGGYRACRIARALEAGQGLLFVGSMDPYFYTSPAGASIEAGMAEQSIQLIEQFRRGHPDGVAIFWAGNYHVYRFGSSPEQTAAQIIAGRIGGPAEFVYLWPVAGTAHICRNRECAVHDVSQGAVPESVAGTAGIQVVPQASVNPDAAAVDAANLSAAC